MRAEEVYVDPSALARLYIHQAGSREMSVWRAKVRGTLAVTHHGRVEVINAMCRAAFLGQLNPDGLAEALTDLTADFASGHLRQADILWRAALNGAAELSQRHTPKLGTRTWHDVPNSAATNRFTVPLAPANGSTFYRLVYP